MDLTREADREVLRAHLGGLYAGRPVLVGPGVLAGFVSTVRMLREVGAGPILILSTGRGAGEVPDVEVVEVTPPVTTSVTAEMRALDGLVRDLPPDVVDRIEAFDPDRLAIWCTLPFVSTDEPILGRPVTGGRPAAFAALEDKIWVEELWATVGIPRATSHVVPPTREALDEASEALGGEVVWSGDTREGFNGGGNYVRWVATPEERAAALPFFAEHCDRVRVLPFLDGVPCSIHGAVLPEGTAVFRPVEIAILRGPDRSFTYGGLSTFWDPPAADREEMRDVARRVGEHLRTTRGYAGMFGIDGVLTADGFRPTELNPRMSAGAAAVVASVDRQLFLLLQANLVAGREPGVSVRELESGLPLMDRVRIGKPVAVGETKTLGGTFSYPVAWDGTRLSRATEDTGTVLEVGDTPTGFFARLEPCRVLRPGDRLAPLNVALTAYLDREYDAGFGPLTPAPSLRGPVDP
ncbi:MAG: hypothetical protein ABWX84_14555 [Nocardioides sp.]